jgi:UDP-N-acetylmuramate dehydrogenase
MTGTVRTNPFEKLKNVRRDVVLAPYTTYRIGGPADFFVEAHDQYALAEAVRAARASGTPFFVLGTGANILVSDRGFRGLVIRNVADHVRFEGNLLTAESGAVVADLIRLTAERSLGGLEHYAGIPSTVGGAIWQNLHFLSPDRARTMYIAEVFVAATLLDGEGNVRREGPEFFDFGYDESILRVDRSLILLEAAFRLEPKPRAEIERQIAENLAWRDARQPPVDRFPSCGSIFKKLDGIGAGRLIEKVGLKGHRRGGAQISEKHANFIVNRGGATSADVLALIATVQREVERQTGHRLEPEINIIGELSEAAETGLPAGAELPAR